MLLNSGVERAESKRHFKCRSRFLAENVEHLGLRQRPWRARPAKFRALSATKLALPLRRDQEHFCLLLRRRLARADEAIPFADEQIAHVQRNGNAMLFVQRLFAVTQRVVVLDVIVDQRRFVKAFHGQRHFANVLRQRRAGSFAQSTFERLFVDETLIGGTTALVRAGSAAVRAAQTGFVRYYAALLLVGVSGVGLYFLLQS